MYPLQWTGGAAFAELEASSALSGEEHGLGFQCVPGARGGAVAPCHFFLDNIIKSSWLLRSQTSTEMPTLPPHDTPTPDRQDHPFHPTPAPSSTCDLALRPHFSLSPWSRSFHSPAANSHPLLGSSTSCLSPNWHFFCYYSSLYVSQDQND